MNLQQIKSNLEKANIFYSEDNVQQRPTVIGYEKVFKWQWIATQLNTFIVATDYGSEPITVSMIESHMDEAFKYSKVHYTGWPRGLQSGLALISIMLSSEVTNQAQEYCDLLQSGKKWSAFTIPVAYDTSIDKAYRFKTNPMWGRIYYPHFRELIDLTLA